jgi:hypothetical protein
MIAANNHYAGFGPRTVNIFKSMIGLPELTWQDQPQIQEQLERQKKQEKGQQSGSAKVSFGKRSLKRQASLRVYEIERQAVL